MSEHEDGEEQQVQKANKKDVIVKNPGEQPMQYGKKPKADQHMFMLHLKTPDDPTDLRNLVDIFYKGQH